MSALLCTRSARSINLANPHLASFLTPGPGVGVGFFRSYQPSLPTFVKATSSPYRPQPAPVRLRIVRPSFNQPATIGLLTRQSRPLPGRPWTVATDTEGRTVFELNARSTTVPKFSSGPGTLGGRFTAGQRAAHRAKRARRASGANAPSTACTVRLLVHVTIKTHTSSAVLRRGLRRKWTSALRTVVQQGEAYHDPEPEEESGDNTNKTERIEGFAADPSNWLLPSEASSYLSRNED